MSNNRQQEYGMIQLVDNNIVRKVNGQTVFEIPVEQISAIGEFTTSAGPYFDDWYVTFITQNDWYEIPMDVSGIDELFLGLGNKLGVDLSYQLTNSTTWKTRIMYPEKLKERELYKIVNKSPKNFIKRLLGLKERVREISPEITNILEHSTNR